MSAATAVIVTSTTGTVTAASATIPIRRVHRASRVRATRRSGKERGPQVARDAA